MWNSKRYGYKKSGKTDKFFNFHIISLSDKFFNFHIISLSSTQTLEYIPVALVEGLIRSLAAMTTTIKMPRPTQTGGLSVCYCYKLGLRDSYPQVPINPSEHRSFFIVVVDVKIDWCASKANGSTLDPKVQYAQFVSTFNFHIKCV